jgi:hypothetical protein
MPMKIHPLYLDFFRFLDEMAEKDPWPSYRRSYLEPHEEFLAAYWHSFDHFSREQIVERVRAIKKEDYGQLRALVRMQDPAVLAEGALGKCREIFPLEPAPAVYLFVGFFSADGATVEVRQSPAIALGLERFRDFKNIPLLVAHEYCHCAQQSLLKGVIPKDDGPLLHKMIAEGLSVLFTELVYPDLPLHRHLFLTPERFQWCRENQEALLELAGADLAEKKLLPIFFGPGDPNAGLPPRLGYFLARQIVGQCLSHHGAEQFGETFPGFADLFRKILESGILASGAEKE